MVREINIINRLGSKDNDIKYFVKYLPIDIKTVVEPFGGSFAVIKKFYKAIHKYNFHINDTDPILFYIYKNYKLYLDSLKTVNEEYLKYPKEDKIRHFIDNVIPSLTPHEHIASYITKQSYLTTDYLLPL
jgi:site-specific DNA-adenine methylase